MTQPPPPDRGPAEESARDSGLPGGSAEVPSGGSPAASDGRDLRLAGFVTGGPGDTCPPSAALAAVVDDLSGPERRCGGARSRRCHRVKQSDGWSVTQPEPGLHQWTTPSGRSYTQGPMRYPA